MNQELFDLATWTLTAAKAAGTDDCRVDVYRERSVEISYRERKPENIKEASTRGLHLGLYVNHRYSSQSTSDLRREALKDFIAQAVASTKLLAEDPFRSLPDPKYYAGRATQDLGLVDPTYPQLAPEERHRQVKALEASCLAAGGPKVISVTADVGDGYGESVMLTSNGFAGYSEGTGFGASVQMSVQDEGDRKPNGYAYANTVMRKNLPPMEEIGVLAAKRTLALVGAKKIPTATLPIIVENQHVPRLLSGLLAAMAGRNLQQKQSFLADKKGQKIASDRLSLVDDPLLLGGQGSRYFDGEGLAAKKRVMIDAGVLQDFYVDWYYGRKLGWAPTTGGSSNLLIPPGTRSVAQIMKDLGKGVLITDFIGGNSNSTTGDTSVGIIGTLFERGELTQPIAEMNIAGNHLQLWQKVAEIANDPWPYSGWRTPSLVFTDIVVSGV